MLLIAVYIGTDGEITVGEIEQGKFIDTAGLRKIYSSNDHAQVDKFIATNKKNYKRDGVLTSLDPNVLSVWSPGIIA